ncbi:hypothetical protein WBG99_02070 [Streptomyces sp. TG1A-60]
MTADLALFAVLCTEAFSIVAHSSTDVPIARLFHVDDLAANPVRT